MKKQISMLVISLIAVVVVSALTSGAVFAFGGGQVKQLLPFFQSPASPQEISKQSAEKTKVEVKGLITDLTAVSITVDGTTFLLNASTDLDSGLVIGSLVEIKSKQLPDGSLLALEVCNELNPPEISPTPVQPPVKIVKMETKGIITDLTADTISIDGTSYRLDPSTDLDKGLEIGSLVEIKGIQLPDGSWLALEVCVEKPAKNEINNQDINEFEIFGVVTLIGDVWMIDGQEISISELIKIDPLIVVGDQVTVEGKIVNGIYIAKSIEKESNNESINPDDCSNDDCVDDIVDCSDDDCVDDLDDQISEEIPTETIHENKGNNGNSNRGNNRQNDDCNDDNQSGDD
jgi:hypothetical protein